GTDPESRAPVLPAVEAEEVIHEQRDVLAPSTERRRRDRDHVEPVIKILAKAPRLDLGEQIAVGRSHDTGVALLDPPTDRLILALLQYPQNFDLYLRTQLADLVEEQRAASRSRESPFAPRDGAGERASLVPEELRLEDALRDRRTVDRDERPRSPRALLVNEPRDELLARPAFAQDHH